VTNVVDCTIEKWASKLMSQQYGSVESEKFSFIEDECSYTLLCDDFVENYILNKHEYLEVKKKMKLKDVNFYSYTTEYSHEILFIFEYIDDLNIIDYVFVLQKPAEDKIDFDLSGIELNGKDQCNSRDHASFFALYGVQTLIALKAGLLNWLSESKEYRLFYLYHPKDNELFEMCDRALDLFALSSD
jgi:hypothetical protein